MVDAAEADVVSPAVAAHDPHTALHEVVGQLLQFRCGGFGHGCDALGLRPAAQLLLQVGHPLPLFVDAGLIALISLQQPIQEGLGQVISQAPQQLLGPAAALVEGHAKAEAEFGVVFKQGIAPGGAAALGIGAPGGGGQVAAIDRGTPGGVGDHHAIAE